MQSFQANPCGDNEGGCYTNDDCQEDLICDVSNDCLASLGFNTGVSCCTGAVVCLYDYIEDGYCNEENNNEECEWDGGDCWGNTDTNFFDLCECLDPIH